MYEIDPARADLVREFEANPNGPYSPELTLVVNRLRLMPIQDRHVLVCTRQGREWAMVRMPARGGGPIELSDAPRFHDAEEAARAVFRARWKSVTGQDPEFQQAKG